MRSRRDVRPHSQGFPRGFPKLVRALYGILTLKRANTVAERG